VRKLEDSEKKTLPIALRTDATKTLGREMSRKKVWARKEREKVEGEKKLGGDGQPSGMSHSTNRQNFRGETKGDGELKEKSALRKKIPEK